MTDAFERAADQAEAERRRRHRERRARVQRKGLRVHATVFVAVQVLLLTVWAVNWQLDGNAYPWFLYPLLGWGIGLAAHWAAVRDRVQPA